MTQAATPQNLDSTPTPGGHSRGLPPPGVKADPSKAITPLAHAGGKDVDIQRLTTSIKHSDQLLRPFRLRHAEAVRLFAGHRYGDGQKLDKTPLNLLRLAVEVWTRQLVSQTPQNLILTRGINAKADAYELELASNHLYSSLDLGRVLAEVVRSAVFTIGILRVGLTRPYLSKRSGFDTATGHPYAEQILFEDFIVDMNARTWDEITYIGNAYRVPLDAVLSNNKFSAEARKHIETAAKHLDRQDAERASSSSGSSALRNEEAEFYRMTELIDIYLPETRQLVTLGSRDARTALRVRELRLPEAGPYNVLAFSSVPGNLMPTGPAQHLAEMQILITRLFNQLARQASRAKIVTLADGKATADGSAQRVAEARDGDVIRVQHPDSIKNMTYDGADRGNVQFVGLLKEYFSYLGGNLDTMGGLAPGSRTIGQEQLLAQSSSEMLRDMQAKVIKFTGRVMEGLAEILYTDPILHLQLTKSIPGLGEVPFDWGPDARRQNFFSYNFEIVPFSEQNQSPQQRLELIGQIVQQYLLPLSQQLQASGSTMDVSKLVELISRYSNLPELMDVVQSETIRTGEQLENQPQGRRPLQSPQTTRTYVTASQKPEPSSAAMGIMSAPPSGEGGE